MSGFFISIVSRAFLKLHKQVAKSGNAAQAQDNGCNQRECVGRFLYCIHM